MFGKKANEELPSTRSPICLHKTDSYVQQQELCGKYVCAFHKNKSTYKYVNFTRLEKLAGIGPSKLLP